MMPGRFRIFWALIAILGQSASPSMGLVRGQQTWQFEGDTTGGPAKGFRTVVGTWRVVADGENQVMVQQAKSGARVFNLALAEDTSYRDLEITVRVKRWAGEEDQGGGMVWRAKDAENYYVVRYNPLEDNLRLYKVEAGNRTQLDHADVPGDGEWHTLRITMKGREILGDFDGKKLLEAEDSTFPDAGRVGLWSKADAQTFFDDLTVKGR